MEDVRLDMRSAVALLGLKADTSKSQVRIPCPFCGNGEHSSKNLSINFDYNDEGSFHCFACEAKGNPVEFWRLMRNLNDYNDAVKDYREYIGCDEKVKQNVKRIQSQERKKVDVDVADIATRHSTYEALLKMLPLSKKHKDNLLKRGLTEAQIKNAEYKTVPLDRLDSIARELAKQGHTLLGVPGFYKKDGKWQLVRVGSGFFIPQRNGLGQIQGMQIRLDDVENGGPRYISLSTRDRECGSPAYTYCHLRIGEKTGTREVIITEGALKADIISAFTGYSVLSIPGVNSQAYLPKALIDLRRKGLARVSIAFDMDVNTNPHVESARDRLIETLCQLSIPYSILGNWDEQYKGLDDWLVQYKSNN